VETEIE